MLTHPSVSPAAAQDTSLDDILAKLDEVERRLHDALALTEASIRVCQQALAATAILRSRLSFGIDATHGCAHLDRRQCGHAQRGAALENGAPGDGPVEPLTTREREVLDLIARGHSNRRIAEALYLSPRTVERHIANLYLKLDVHTKAEATAWALVHGLIGDPSGSNGQEAGSGNGWRPENYVSRLHRSTDA